MYCWRARLFRTAAKTMGESIIAIEPEKKPAPDRPGKVVDHPASALGLAAKRARPQKRHFFALVSFALLVIAPSLASVGYLYTRAADQYASTLAFSIRGNEPLPQIGLLGMIAQNVSGGGTDAEIIYEFIRSQQMVEAALVSMPLETMFNRPERDFVFRLGEGRPIEDMVEYWNWTTDITFDGATGLVRFEARAFDPGDARRISEFVLAESTRIVNDLSAQARQDAVNVAKLSLTEAENRLRDVRRKVREFRDVERALDPTEDARAALGLMAVLEQSLAETQVERDTQAALIGPRAPQIARLNQRIESLQKRIDEERGRLGAGAGAAGVVDGERLFSELLGEYEDLRVEREFAEQAYMSTLAAYEQSQVEARRQTRYLSPHIAPTLSVEAQHPQRAMISMAIFIILLVSWSVMLLVVYNIRDRR